VTVHGHCRREISEAVAAQLAKLDHSTMLGLSNVPATELAAKLAELAPPGLARVFYSDSGSTAVEIALKIAFQYCRQAGREKRKRFVHFTNSYHGDTIGSVSLGGIDLFHQVYGPLLFETYAVSYPYCYRCRFDKSPETCGLHCAGELDDVLAKHGEEIAAVVIEPLVQGAAGMLMAPPGHLRRVRELCDRHGVLLVCDEVATGWGRTGRLWACGHEGVSPDILCTAKGLTGGCLPLAATITTEEVFRGFLGEYESRKTFFHGHTYTGNPLACVAALASIEIFERDGTLERMQPRIEQLAEGLRGISGMDHVGAVRQRGLMAGIELVKDKATKEPYEYAERMGHRVILEARRRGVILRPLGDVVVLMPPLVIGEEEVAQLLRVTAESIEAATRPG
jgi:adenosylmethionine-8-amino-7-oxononanoate aminotransferase